MMAYDLNILADGEIPADKSGAIGLFAIACDAGKGVNADGEYAPLDDLGDSNLSDTYHVFADSYRLPEDEDKTNRTKADLLDSLAVGGFTRAQAFHQLLLLTEMVEMGKVNGTVIGGDAGPMPYDKATYDKVFVLVKKIIGE
jgi:hypothetical protein